jgi:hypothetical protein
MQKTLRRWRLNLLLLSLLCCSNFIQVNGQLSYTFSKINGTFDELDNPTTIFGGAADEGMSNVTNIGFDFRYGCDIYTQFRAGTNGWITLGNNASTNNLTTNNLGTTGRGPIIAPLWDDLRTASSGITSKVTGTAPNRVLTVEWLSMRWNTSASGWVISFQVRLYETTNRIEFQYQRNGTNVNNGSASIGITGGTFATDFYSVSGVSGTTAATYGVETNNINQKPDNGTIYRWTPNNMSYVSSTTTQVTGSISKCNSMQQAIIGVKVVTSGCLNFLSLTSLNIRMNGTTTNGNVYNIRIYYTGNNPLYIPVNEFANTTNGSGTITLSGSQALTGGDNYFWIAYDINPGTPLANVFDAECTQITVAGVARTPTVTVPTGNRSFVDCPIAPGGINNASFWVKADDGPSTTTNNTKFGTWNDRSGNGRNATNSGSDNQPRYYNNSTNNVNFNPVVDFDAAGQDEDDADFMDINGNGILSSGNNPYEVYAVIVPGASNLTAPGKFLFAGEAGANNFNAFDVRANYSVNDSWNMNDLIIPNMWATDKVSLFAFDFNMTQRETFVAGQSSGVLIGSLRTAANANNALGYQRTASLEFYDGSIAEIITYANNAHGTPTREKVESYLGIKYGVTLGHNYVSSRSTVVWNRTVNVAYNNNIIGLARDSISALSQKQSKSTSIAPDILTIYLGSTKQVNQKDNTSTFTAGDRSFFMVGSNNALALDSWPSTPEKPAGICCRIMREWLVQKTNFTNTDLRLEFDFNAITTGYLPLNAGDLRLLVDADGNFSNATILNTPAITITAAAGVATITVPASVFNSTPYFTLASVSTNTLLPLQLKAFSGLCKDQAVQVKWTTGTPATADFSVERSNDKVNFSAAGTVKPNGSANYVWTDQSPLPGTLYYRLKTTNDNGMVLSSPVITVNSCNTTGIQLSTNPMTNRSTLMLQLSQNDLTEISLYDLMGRRSDVPGLTGKRSMEKGVHYLPVNIPGTVAGMYLLHVVVNGERHVYKIIKK